MGETDFNDGRVDTTTSAPPLDLQGLLAGLAALAQAVQKLPSDADELAYESSFPEFQSAVQSAHQELLQILQQNMASATSHSGSATAKLAALEMDHDDPESNSEMSMLLWNDLSDPLLWEHCADMCDTLVEQVEAYVASRSTGATASATRVDSLRHWRDQVRTTYDTAWDRIVAATDMSMAKPQDVHHFTTHSSRTTPFVPTLHPDQPFRLHRIDNIQELLQPGMGYETRWGTLRTTRQTMDSSHWIGPNQHCPHLYETEIRSFQYTALQLQVHEPTGTMVISDPTDVPTLPFVWIDSEQALQELATKLQSVTAVAMDLEAHSYRSYAGMLCLMQISFRGTVDMCNYLIDCLALHHCINQHLASVLANPAIVKVMHGADSDIQWLQRDFGLYVCNLFDTGRAARQLRWESASYAYLLQRYTGIVADKSLQLADWRQRPLSPAMQQYAVQDTHCLLDMYERLKWDLAQSDDTSIAAVLDQSRQVCLIRYCPEPFDPNGYHKLLRNRGTKHVELNGTQEAILKALWDWRDQTARSADESPAYVCTNANLLRMALSGSNLTVTKLQGLFNPVPPLILRNAQSITEVFKRATAEFDASQEKNAKQAGVLAVKIDTGGDASGASATFFKPRQSEVEHTQRGIMSPVLGTEALYEHAGWMTPLDLGKTVTNKGDVALDPVTTTDDDEGDGVQADSSKPKKLLSVHSSNQNYRSTEYTEHSLELGQGADNRIRGRSVDGMGSVRAAVNAKSPTGKIAEDEVNKARADAGRIQRDLKFQQDSIPSVLGLVAIKGSDDDEDDDDGGHGASGTTEGQQVEGMPEDEIEFPIPRSIREIYKISNRNRRNKKTGSPTPDHDFTPTNEKEREELAKAEALLVEHSDTVVGYFDESASPGKRHKTKSGRESEDSLPDASINVASKDDDLAFMTDIGWIQNKDDMDSIVNQRFGRVRNEDEEKTRSADDTVSMGVIHPSLQAGGNNNPFFSGAAASGGGPLTQHASAQHQRGGVKKPNAAPATSTNNTKGKSNNRNRQPERPERKDNRTQAYRKR